MTSYSLNSLYRALGISKQAVHDYQKRQTSFDEELSELIVQVDAIREEHPGCGVEKMYETLRPTLMGRDKFCSVFMELGYRVQKIRNYHRTTIPTHLKFPNLIEGMQLVRPYQLLQSDITYFDLGGRFYYLVFIIDVYTREILSHSTSNNQRTESNLKALRQALGKITIEPYGCIHHSDRGSQYASNEYVALLKKNGIHISMGVAAQDNAYAERINGTIKNEYLKRWKIRDEKDLRSKVKKAVKHYNEKRKHKAFSNQYSPMEFKRKILDLGTQNRPKVIIYAEGNYEIKEASSLLNFNAKTEPQAHNCPIAIY